MKNIFISFIFSTFIFANTNATVSLTHFYDSNNNQVKNTLTVPGNTNEEIFITGTNLDSLKGQNLFTNLNFDQTTITFPADLVSNNNQTMVAVNLDSRSLKFVCNSTTQSISIHDGSMNTLTASKIIKLHINCN